MAYEQRHLAWWNRTFLSVTYWGWALIVGVAAVILFFISANLGDGKSSTTGDAEYRRVRAACEARATAVIERDGLYRVGGPQWADKVNSCMVDEVSR